VEEGKAGSESINRLQRRLRRALIVVQLGGTLSLVALGWLSQSWSRDWWLNNLDYSRLLDGILFLSIVIASTIISGFIPKALVLNRPEISALKIAPLLETVMAVLAPALFVLEKFASIFLRLIGLNAKWDSLVPALSAGELETLIETGGVTGLRPDERNILEGVFALRDTQVREVMVPRAGMVTLPIDVKFSELMQAVYKTRHARFPVIGESLDDVRGVLDLRQLAASIANGRMQAESPLKPFLEAPTIVLETSTLAELIPLFRSGKPLLIVVDEHGGTEGLVTAADLTGEIVGEEIENTKQEPELEEIEGKSFTWFASGDLEILEINRQLKLELPESDDHHTLAGFILEKFQHIPEVGEVLNYGGISFDITSMKGPRIERVKITLPKIELEAN
tara:strand:+ start:162 stop:1343 length:1182 start_codon:yes stop_codon:yes gene_type:complete